MLRTRSRTCVVPPPLRLWRRPLLLAVLGGLPAFYMGLHIDQHAPALCGLV